MYKYILLKTTGEIEVIDAEDREKGKIDFQRCHDLIGCGMTDYIPAQIDSDYYLCVDDVGRIMDRPLNPLATICYSNKDVATAVNQDEYIVGNALIFKAEGPIHDRNLRCLDDEEAAELTTKLRQFLK